MELRLDIDVLLLFLFVDVDHHCPVDEVGHVVQDGEMFVNIILISDIGPAVLKPRSLVGFTYVPEEKLECTCKSEI